MSARILDGKRIAQELLERIGRRVAERKAQGQPEPGLAVVLVGDDAASSVYVRNKRKACHQVGFRSFDYDLPASTTQDRKSTRLNSSHPSISYAVFCLKKKIMAAATRHGTS